MAFNTGLSQETTGVQITELYLAAFEADGTGVGDVVTGDIQILL